MAAGQLFLKLPRKKSVHPSGNTGKAPHILVSSGITPGNPACARRGRPSGSLLAASPRCPAFARGAESAFLVPPYIGAPWSAGHDAAWPLGATERGREPAQVSRTIPDRSCHYGRSIAASGPGRVPRYRPQENKRRNRPVWRFQEHTGARTVDSSSACRKSRSFSGARQSQHWAGCGRMPTSIARFCAPIR